MNRRRIRNRRHRAVLGASFMISLALHGILLGALSIQPLWEVAVRPIDSLEPLALREPSIELVRIEQVPEEVVPDPVHADAPVLLTTPASSETPEPKSGDAPVAASGEAAAAAAAPAGGANAADDPLPAELAFAEAGIPSVALSMRPRFGIQHTMPESTRKPITALDPLADADHAEGEGEEEESWWRRLGAKFGIGGGSKICVPRPEVMDTGPEDPKK